MTIQEIRKKYSTNVFDVEFKGSLLSFTNSMWGGFEVISHKKNEEFTIVRIKLINGNSPNTLLKHISNKTIQYFLCKNKKIYHYIQPKNVSISMDFAFGNYNRLGLFGL